MSDKCKCGSFAINPHLCSRQLGVDLDLCDVCYWHKRAVDMRERCAKVCEADAMVSTLTEAGAMRCPPTSDVYGASNVHLDERVLAKLT